MYQQDLSPHKMAVLLERNEKRHPQIHCKLCPVQKEKSKNADEPSVDDGYTWSTLWQNSHRSHHIPEHLHIRKPTHSNYHWPFDGMARSFSHSWQKGGCYCPCLYQQLSHHPLCPRFIPSDNKMELKNQPIDIVLKQLDTDCIISAPYHP